MERSIAAIDLKSFYATVECIERGLDPFSTPLVVCDEERSPNTIVLAASPYAKQLGIPSRCRKYELPHIKGLILAVPRMELYVKKSAEVMDIIFDFVGEDDVHIYSIDEAFIDLTPYLKMYKMTPRELTKKIMDTILERTGLFTTAGIGPNILMAKVSLDIEGKKAKDSIAEWTMNDVQTKLWPITPLTKMWGISHNLERRLNALGIRKIGDLATYPLEILKEKFGIMGEQLYNHANGIDEAQIREKYVPESTSLSLGQTLFRDYTFDETKLLLREMVDDLCYRMRTYGLKTNLISFSAGYSKPYDFGFGKQISLDHQTDDNNEIYKTLMHHYEKYRTSNYFRKLYISFGKFSKEEYEQLDLFIDQEEKEKNKNLNKALDEIKHTFGKSAVLRATSQLDTSMVKIRNKQIGGHRK